MGRTRALTVDNFFGGVNENVDASALSPIELSSMQNMFLEADGSLRTRHGFTKLTSKTFPDLIEGYEAITAQVTAVNESYEAQTAYSQSIIGQSGGQEYRSAQSFQVSSNITCTEAAIELDSNNGSPTGNIRIRIETDSASAPSGTLVDANATATVAGAASSWNKVTFPDSFTLTSSTTYWMVVSHESLSDGNFFRGLDTAASAYANGNFEFWDGSWNSTANDLNFRIYEETTAANPTTSDDVTGLADDSAEKIQLVNSVTFDKTGTTEATGHIEYSYTGSTKNLSSYSGFRYFLKLDALTDVSKFTVRFGSSASDYAEFDVADTALTTSWNFITIADKTAPDATGGTIDWTAIDRIRLTITLDAAGDTLSNINIDHLVGIPSSANRVYGLHQYIRSNGTKTVMAVANTNWYTYDSTYDEWLVIKDDLTADQTAYMVTYTDRCLLQNGTDTPQYYDGTNVRQLGIDQASTPTTGAAGSGALNSGTYRWKAVYYNSTTGEEGEASAKLEATQGAASDRIVNLTQSSDAQVDQIRVYRTLVDGAIYYLEGETSNTSSPTFTSTLSDEELATNNLLIRGTKKTPTAGQMVVHKNRLFCVPISDPSTLAMSRVGLPGSFLDSDYITFAAKDGEDISGFSTFVDAIVVHKPHKVFGVIGDIFSADEGTNNIIVRQLNVSRGAISPRAIINYQGTQYYQGFDGVYALNASLQGDNVFEFANVPSDNIGINMRPTLDTLHFNNFTNSVIGEVDNKLLLSFTPTGQTQNTKTLVYDMRLKAWIGEWTNFNSLVYATYDPNDGNPNELLFGKTDGYIYKYDNTVTNDDSTAISYEFKTKRYHLGEPTNTSLIYQWKRLKDIYVTVNNETSDYNITVEYIFDRESTGTMKDLDVNEAGDVWDTAPWDSGIWDDGAGRLTRRLDLNGRFKTVQLKFNHSTLNQPARIYGIEFVYTFKPRRDYSFARRC